MPRLAKAAEADMARVLSGSFQSQDTASCVLSLTAEVYRNIPL